jgi:hypothetical protein
MNSDAVDEIYPVERFNSSGRSVRYDGPAIVAAHWSAVRHHDCQAHQALRTEAPQASRKI